MSYMPSEFRFKLADQAIASTTACLQLLPRISSSQSLRAIVVKIVPSFKRSASSCPNRTDLAKKIASKFHFKWNDGSDPATYKVERSGIKWNELERTGIEWNQLE